MCRRSMTAAVFFGLLLTFFRYPASAWAAGGAAYALYDAFSGEFIEEKNADEKRPAASTAKIMTALVAAEEGDLAERIPILREDTAVEGSRVYLEAGEEPTLEELLAGVLLASGNDAAMAAARGAAGSVKSFTEKMNRRAERIGMTGTHYENPTGLDGEGQVTTARDLALLAAEAMKNETVARLFRTRYASFGGHVLKNHNKLLWKSADCVGGKTGFTRKAGRCLVSVFEKSGRRMIAVTLSDPDDWQDHLAFADRFYREVEEREISFSFPVRTADFEREEGVLLASVALPLRPGEKEKLTYTLEADHFLWRLPDEGEATGLFRVFLNGREIAGGAPFFAPSPGRKTRGLLQSGKTG